MSFPSSNPAPLIIHHGARTSVTGSCHELRLADGPGLLIDCGLFQGAEEAENGAGPSRLEIRFPIDHIRALVVTHVHIDHVGRIPYLLAAGFRGPVYCSEASAVLLPLVLEDAVKIGVTRDRRLIERFLARVKTMIVPLPYGDWQRVVDASEAAIDIRLKPAGHILGSAYVECRVREKDARENAASTVVFSGDLGAPYAPLLPAPRSPFRADMVVLESTYGDRVHEGRGQRRKRLKRVIEKALHDRGVVLVPAFSIGRTQELLYELEGIIHRHGARTTGRRPPWPELEIVVDSPLAARFTEAYRDLRPHWDAEARRRVRAGRHPLAFDQLTTVDSHTDHLRAVEHLARGGRPTVVIAGSGMCTGGRIVDYLEALIGEPRTDILFVGYQAAGTPGRDIQRYGPRGGWVELEGRRHTIRAGVHTLPGYSAHADRDDLVRFVRRMRRKPAEIRLVHGEAGAKAALADGLREVCPGAEILIPES